MATATGLVIRKTMPYRDVPEEWSNKYWLTGPPPSDDGGWRNLAGEIEALEVKCYFSIVKVVGFIGYNDNDPHAHASWTYEYDIASQPSGTLPVVANEPGFSGDQAGMIEWRTSRKNSRGKWIYLRKYLHGGTRSATDIDKLSSEASLAYQALADALGNGTIQGQRRIRSQAQDEVLTANIVSEWVTTRTLRRRGKRP